jgi:hypothetical protein
VTERGVATIATTFARGEDAERKLVCAVIDALVPFGEHGCVNWASVFLDERARRLSMRTWKLISGVGVAIVAAWLAVTNLAYAATEFTCEVPWHGPIDTCFPKLDIPARGVVRIEVYTIRDKDGEDLKKPATFQILDTENKDAVVTTFDIRPHQSSLWVYESSLKMLVAKIRVNHPNVGKTTIRGNYSIK